jgi:hypothetical protein
MATLTSTLVAGTTYVRLELDWSSLPEVQYVRIMRLRAGETYNTSTNTGGTAVRLPSWGNTFTDDIGTWTYLSNSRGVWYDTEAPLDVPVTYVAVARPFTTLVRDAFGRTVANDWGSPDFGPSAYTEVVTAGDYDVAGGKGTIQPTANTSYRIASTTFLIHPSAVEARTTFAWSALPATGQLRAGIVMRYSAVTDFYAGEAQIATTGIVTARIIRVTGGTTNVIATVALGDLGFTYVAAAVWRIAFRLESDTWYLKVWPSSQAEPTDWQLSIFDATQTGSNAGLMARNDTAVTTQIASFDDFLMSEIAQSTSTVSSTPAVTVDSLSSLWLKDPLRPGLDLQINLCPTGPSGCTQPTGVFFHSMGPLTRKADAQVRGMGNRVVPSATFRARKAPTGELRLVSRTLPDRDRLLALLASGSPLLLQAPAAYGLPDRYLLVGDTGEDRIHSDHRVPFRFFTLPWSEVDAPGGGGEGTPETRWDDLCTNYATWTLLIAAGWTWTDIMQGDAA